MTGLTVKEYIRKRRLSNSAQQLHCTKLPITDIAFNAGYESLESFTRSFKKHFGVNPREFRKSNQEHLLFERLDIFKMYVNKAHPHPDFKLDLENVLYKETYIQGFQIHTTLEGGQQAMHTVTNTNMITYT